MPGWNAREGSAQPGVPLWRPCQAHPRARRPPAAPHSSPPLPTPPLHTKAQYRLTLGPTPTLVCRIHTKALYRLTLGSRDVVKGCTDDMCCTSWLPRGLDPEPECLNGFPQPPHGPP